MFYELGQKVIDFILQTRNHQGELQKLVQILFDELFFFALLDYKNKKYSLILNNYLEVPTQKFALRNSHTKGVLKMNV